MAFAVQRIYLILLLFFEGTRAFHLANVIINSHLLPDYSYYVIAPELFRSGSFAFATVETSQQKSDKVGIDISVSIADSTDYSKCSLTLGPDDSDNDIIVTSLRRLGEKKVVLMGSEVYKNGRRKGLLFVLDVKKCEELYLYSSFDLSGSDVLVTRETSDKFEIFVDGPSDHRECAESKSRITFQSGKKESNCFDVGLRWPRMFVGAFSFSEDVVMVRGFDDAGTYKTLVYNTAAYPYRQQLWLTLPPRATNKTQVVSSDLAVCWILNLGDDKSVHCSLLDRAGDLRLNETLTYKQPVRLLSVSSHSESRSEIILMTEKAHCEASDCKSVFVSKVSSGQSTSHRVIKLDCSAADKKRLAVDVRQIIAKGAIVLEYVCESTLNPYSPNYFALHSVSIDDS